MNTPHPLQQENHLTDEPDAATSSDLTHRQPHLRSLSPLGFSGQRFAQDPLLAPLEQLYQSFDYRARTTVDPVSLVRAAQNMGDREIVALFSSALAYGRVASFMVKLRELFDIMDSEGGPRRFVMNLEPDKARKQFAHLRHRVTPGSDLLLLASALKQILLRWGSLEAAFASHFELTHAHIGIALEAFVDSIYQTTGASHRSFLHLLPSPSRGSACKRLNLFLRWMVRQQEGLDPGGWTRIPRSHLLLPLDTHTLRMAQRIGLTDRHDSSFRTVLEVTARLRRLDPEDPVKYDFALCHLAMSGGCALKPEPATCDRCHLRDHCRVVSRQGP